MREQQKKEYPSVQDMSDDQRIGIVKDIFASVTDRYDFLNRFLSGRRDVAWRKRTVQEMNFFNTNRFLDVATGTGDLALDCANTYPDVIVTGVDFVQEMVDNGLKKVDAHNLNARVDLKWGDATNIEYDDNFFDEGEMLGDLINDLKNVNKTLTSGRLHDNLKEVPKEYSITAIAMKSVTGSLDKIKIKNESIQI